MNTIWGFGCSYTQGWWNTRYNRWTGEWVYVPYNSVSGRTVQWDNRFSDYYHLNVASQKLLHSTGIKYQVKNYGNPGHGERSTLYTLLRHLQDIQPGDIVVIGSTHDNRETYLVKNDGIADPCGIYLRQFTLQEITHIDKLKKCPSKDKSIHREKLQPWLDTVSEEELQVMSDDFLILGMGDTHQLYLERKYLQMLYSNIGLTLEKIGVKTYLWDSTLWRTTVDGREMRYNEPGAYFENSFTWSNEDLIDYHWSPNGNIKAGLFFYWCMVNGHKYFDKSLLQQFDECGLGDEFEYLHYEDVMNTSV